MKSFCLIIFFILTIFVIKSETSTEGEDQVDARLNFIIGGGSKVWLKEVDGFNGNDPSNGYSGIYEKPVTGLRVSGGKPYKVHLLNVGWLPKIKGNDINNSTIGYAGSPNGIAIDAVIIDGGNKYAVHVLGEDWLPPVTGNDIHDSKNGYSGIIGKPIDAIMIENRSYATSFNDFGIDADKCSKLGGSCTSSKNCEGTVVNKLCSGGEDNKCCISKKYIDDAGDYDDYDYNEEEDKKNGGINFNIIFIIIIIVLFIVILVVVLYFYHKRNAYKKNTENIPDLPQGLPQDSPSNLPPDYESIFGRESTRLNTNHGQTNQMYTKNHNPSRKSPGTIVLGMRVPEENVNYPSNVYSTNHDNNYSTNHNQTNQLDYINSKKSYSNYKHILNDDKKDFVSEAIPISEEENYKEF